MRPLPAISKVILMLIIIIIHIYTYHAGQPRRTMAAGGASDRKRGKEERVGEEAQMKVLRKRKWGGRGVELSWVGVL